MIALMCAIHLGDAARFQSEMVKDGKVGED